MNRGNSHFWPSNKTPFILASARVACAAGVIITKHMTIITHVAQIILPLLLLLEAVAVAVAVIQSNETFWCGRTITDALEICLQSCPTTISSDCPIGTSCWYTGELTACNEYSTISPTMTVLLPTNTPTSMPSDHPSEAPILYISTGGGGEGGGGGGQGGQSLISYIESKKELIDKYILVSYYKRPSTTVSSATTTASGIPYPSTKIHIPTLLRHCDKCR